MAEKNRQFIVNSRPEGEIEDDTFKLLERPIPEPKDGEFLARALYLSVDPYMRGRLREGKSYVPPVAIGDVMTGGVVAQVAKSRHPDFEEGDIVEGRLGWQEYAVSDGSEGVRKVDPDLAPITTALGVLGMPGMTAYFGLLEVGQPKAGETVVVSAASGAVGGLVGQIARIKGCRTVGIAGTDTKCRYCREELDYDAVINHRATEDWDSALREAAPDGIDVYFDNVGGRILDAVLQQINIHARIPICGMISEYNSPEPELAPRPTRALLVNRARMQGLIVFDWADRYAEGITAMAQWIKEDKIRYREDIVEGFENMPYALNQVLHGENFGKKLVKAGDQA